MLNRLAKKLLVDGSLEVQDYRMIEMSEGILQQNLFRNNSLMEVVEQLQNSTNQASERIPDKKQSQSWDFDFEQGLDEAHDLDWDTEGMELSCSTTDGGKEATPVSFSSKTFSHSPVSDMNKLSPLDSIGRVIEETPGKSAKETTETESESQIPKSTSYQGVYEEAMEMSLELEEGFYSDLEEENETLSSIRLQITKPAHYMSKISVYEVDELKTHTTSPCNYHLVSIDDDMRSIYSTDSSHQNSPHLQRKNSTASAPPTNIPRKPSAELSSLVNPQVIANKISSLSKTNPAAPLEVRRPDQLGRRRYNSERSADTKRMGLDLINSTSSHRKTVFAKMSPSLHHRHNFMTRRLPVFV